MSEGLFGEGDEGKKEGRGNTLKTKEGNVNKDELTKQN